MTLCTDTPEAIREGRARHGLQATMLSDRGLEAIDQFGLRDRGNPSLPPGLGGLPIPTSLLVDADGTVVWKDQAEDFQRRSEPEDVVHALREHFA